MTARPKHFIILSPFFHPEPISTGKYNTHLARALVDRGHRVTVLCSHPLYPTWIPQHTESELDGMRIIRGGSRVRYPRRAILRRAVLELWFSQFVLRTALELDGDAVVVSVLPPSLFSVAARLRHRTARHVAIVHDLQHVHASSQRVAGLKPLVELIESQVFRKFDSLIFLSDTMRQRAVADYSLDEARTAVAYPFVTLTSVDRRESGDRLATLLPDSRRHVVYSGALGEKQNPDRLVEFFVEAARLLPDVAFHVFSSGPIFERLRAQHGDDVRITFRPLVEERDLAELYRRSAVQVVPQAPGTSEGSLPSKLPNILVNGTPALVISDPGSELESLAGQFDNMICATDWNLGTLIESLRRALAAPRGPAPRAAELFSIDRLLGLLEAAA